MSVCAGRTPFPALWLTQCPGLPSLPPSEGISGPRRSGRSWGVAAHATRSVLWPGELARRCPGPSAPTGAQPECVPHVSAPVWGLGPQAPLGSWLGDPPAPRGCLLSPSWTPVFFHFPGEPRGLESLPGLPSREPTRGLPARRVAPWWWPGTQPLRGSQCLSRLAGQMNCSPGLCPTPSCQGPPRCLGPNPKSCPRPLPTRHQGGPDFTLPLSFGLCFSALSRETLPSQPPSAPRDRPWGAPLLQEGNPTGQKRL